MPDWVGGIIVFVVIVAAIGGLLYWAIHDSEVQQARNNVRFSACREAGYSDIIQWSSVEYCVTIRDGELRGVPLAPLLEEVQ